jgi:2-amino-4-hydroxy-6-hydroxymethyldihydropteridine diphosphokinase
MPSTPVRWCPAYVGIGSNLESPQDQVVAAIRELSALPVTVVTRSSSLFRSAPFGPIEQGDFVNAVAAMMTQLTAHQLHTEMRTIEDNHGRTRDGERWGPRTLDLDLLVFSDEQIADDVLTVPHPGISERNFVLLPLNELAPHLIVPGQGSIATLTNAVKGSGGRIERIREAST